MNTDTNSTEKAYNIIRPMRVYTEEQHEIAYLKYLMSKLSEKAFDLAYEVMEDGRYKNDLATSIISMCDLADDGKQLSECVEMEFGSITRQRFKEQAEHGWHTGDCTACCFTCMRCYVDEFYGVNTCAWDWDKHEGSRLLNLADAYWKEFTQTPGK